MKKTPIQDGPSLFDFDFESETERDKPPKTTAQAKDDSGTKTAPKSRTATAGHKPAAAVPPAALKSLQGEIPIEDLLRACGKHTLTYHRYSSFVHYNGTNWTVHDDTGRYSGRWVPSADIEYDQHSNTRTLLHMATDGVLWRSSAIFCKDEIRDTVERFKKVHIQRWRQCDSIATDKVLYVLQNEDLNSIVERTNPYLYRFATESGHDYNMEVLAQAPQLEILHKAGYAFTEKLLNKRTTDSELECFNRLCRPGRNPKEIFKTSKTVYTVLKDCRDLETWDTFRKMDKTGRLKQDCIQQAYDNRYRNKELERINTILGKSWNGKPVFTWETLINYLNRIDQYEAIPAAIGLEILDDYLECCRTLGMKPKTDGDSLKREHDIAARLVCEHRNEIKAKAMEEAGKLTEKYNYTEEVFSVRGIRNYDDLLDEAKQQHNCVASFANKIAENKSLIFVMRETANPDRSLITIELAPKTLEVRQKYLAYNKPIHNKAQSEFIERWLKQCRATA